MSKRYFLLLFLSLGAFSATAVWMAAQQGAPDVTVFHVTVDMVQLNVAVTDSKGNYVTGLRPGSFTITEDRIPQRIATFGEENEVPRSLADFAGGEGKPKLVESSSSK